MTIPPIQVQSLGQSIWTDNISRRIIDNGELQQLVEVGGVLGLTSNPSIFQQSIGESSDYDEVIHANLDLDAVELYEKLAVRDIQDAADLLRGVYDRTQAQDGYVSLEVSPKLAHDATGTVAEAKRLYRAVNRPNLMIKIPATIAGLSAIEETIASGISVNVTLIFSVANYEVVAEAYIRGIERLHASGGDISKVASVASFFISRIDSLVDDLLNTNVRSATGRDLDRIRMNDELLGKVAIANAKLAYASYQRLFEGERFATLRQAGAQAQRPLWASTSTKNPNYPATYYVDTLIGKNTVNTLPPSTLKAFTASTATPAETLTQDLDAAQQVMNKLAEVGVDMHAVTERLQLEGIDKFVDSFDKLIGQVETKRVMLMTNVMEMQRTALGIYRQAVDHALTKLDGEHINGRIWNKDATIWKDNPNVMTKIVNRLGWLDVLNTMDLPRLKALQTTIQASAFKHVVLLGMGGSSLAPEVLFKTFGQQDGFPDLRVLDNTDPAQVAAIRNAVDLEKTLFIVSSKSGGTLETLSFYRYFFELTHHNGSQFLAITDEGSILQTIAQENQFMDVFINPSDIGGRYSALSYFGLVPAALIGLDLDRLWESATRMFMAIGEDIPASQHPGLWLGAIMGQMYAEKRDKLVIVASQEIESFGDWAEQLIAESTGKEGVGVVPVVGGPIAAAQDYASDRVFIYLKLVGAADNEEMDAKVRALREAGQPRITYHLKDKYDLAGEFLRFEYGTAIAGYMLKINPFDEPNVSEAKANTDELLKYYAEHGTLPTQTPDLTNGAISLYMSASTREPLRELCEQHNFNSENIVEVIAAQIVGTRAGDYFGILTYAPVTKETSATLQLLQKRLRHATRRAVTYGYGPRYLHSTGQLHKGGANNGIFFQFTHDDVEQIAIPQANYDFGTLKTAQAAGDIKALTDHKRRSIRIHVSDGNIQGALEALLKALDIVDTRRTAS